ncbi:MAG: hypothetical protein C5B57_08925 [Blastocatellia bacterium]|nr:MAG: hypothetical protein C5B57_08925 [Blastocatellia bacterium]
MFLHAPDMAQACGDKFLLVGRGAKFHRAYAALYPASIVIYAQPRRHAATAIRDPRLQNDLKLAGHRMLVAEDEAAFARALESDRVDLVLTDVADADRIVTIASRSSTKPTILPVMYEPTPDEVKAIEARFMCRLKSSDRPDRYLIAIDDAMKARKKK